MTKTTRTSFRFSEETVSQLRQLAELEKRSMASTIEVLISREFDRRFIQAETPSEFTTITPEIQHITS